MPLREHGGLQEPPHYLESKVRFSFSKCNTDNFCIRKLDTNELERFYTTLGKFEQYTWRDMRKLKREKGLSIDKRDGNISKLLEPQLPGCTTFGHFRVNGCSVNIRIFVGLNGDLAYVGLIDRTGKLQH